MEHIYMSESQTTNTQTVTMGCKLPNGLIIEHGKGDARKSFTLKGANASRIVGGYGLTPGVPKELAEAWIKAHQHFAYVRDGSVFIQGNMSSAESRAKEGRGIRTGLEAVDPMKPPKGITVDPAAEAAYRAQVAANPSRNAQQVE
jgi:hypothetical protein